MSSEAERKFQKDNPIAYAAWQMAQVYENNRDENGKLSATGFMHISHLFGQISMEERGYVFMAFLSELDGRGIEYDTSEFVSEGDVN